MGPSFIYTVYCIYKYIHITITHVCNITHVYTHIYIICTYDIECSKLYIFLGLDAARLEPETIEHFPIGNLENHLELSPAPSEVFFFPGSSVPYS